MARILHLVIWITFMTVSAKRNKNEMVTSSSPYEVERQPTRTQNRDPNVNTNLWQTFGNILSKPNLEQKRPCVDDPAQRAAVNGSYKIMRQPYVATRRGEMSSSLSDRVVFPEPDSRPSQLKFKIPKNCKTGICETIEDYPIDLAQQAAMKVGLEAIRQIDEPVPPEVEIHQRLGSEENNVELCAVENKVVYPEAAQDKNGKWHVIINFRDQPLQGISVELCDTTRPSCASMLMPGFDGTCQQKYVFRKMSALAPDGTTVEKLFKVPSCCSCRAKVVR